MNLPTIAMLLAIVFFSALLVTSFSLMVATLAPGFVEPLLNYYRSLPEDEDGATIREAYTTVVVPAMWVAIEAGGHDDEFARRALTLIEASGG
jgi:hypothetical protein